MGGDAKVGELVSFNVVGTMRASDIRRGMVASNMSADPAADCDTFTAQVIVLDHPGFGRGFSPQIAVHTAQVPCEFQELISRIDRKTGKEAEPNPERIKTGEVVQARMRPCGGARVCIEQFSAYPSLGRFAVRDQGKT